MFQKFLAKKCLSSVLNIDLNRQKMITLRKFRNKKLKFQSLIFYSSKKNQSYSFNFPERRNKHLTDKIQTLLKKLTTSLELYDQKITGCKNCSYRKSCDCSTRARKKIVNPQHLPFVSNFFFIYAAKIYYFAYIYSTFYYK